jgi:hypothetical protein
MKVEMEEVLRCDGTAGGEFRGPPLLPAMDERTPAVSGFAVDARDQPK